jgi:uncharacterized protein YoxC
LLKYFYFLLYFLYHTYVKGAGMGVIEVAVIIAAIAIVVLTSFAIPVLIAMRNTMNKVELAATKAETAVGDLHEALMQVKILSAEATERLEEVRPLTEAISETGRHVRSINSVLGVVTNVVASSSMWMTGAKVAGRFVLDRFTKKGGE